MKTYSKLEIWAKAQEKDLGRKNIWEQFHTKVTLTAEIFNTPMGKD